MSDMGSKMKRYFIGPMPAQKFLDKFFPLQDINTSLREKVFVSGDYDEVVSWTTETQAYSPFVGCYLTCSVTVLLTT